MEAEPPPPPPNEKQILFVFQCANFCPRVLIVPQREFEAVRANALEVARRHAQSQVTIRGVLVHHLLVQNYIWKKSASGDNEWGEMKHHPWSEFMGRLCTVVDTGTDVLPSVEDKVWAAKAEIPFDVQQHFDPVDVYAALTSSRDFAESFLVLEAANGKTELLTEPTPFKTVDEMNRALWAK